MTMVRITALRRTRRARRKRRGRRVLDSRGRSVLLYMRARAVPAALLGIVLVAAVAWFAADWLVHRPWSTGADSRIPVVVAAPLLAVVLVSAGLGGADEELERTTPARWSWIRILHLGVVAVIVGGVLAATGLWEPRLYGAFELVRNSLGFLGMVALAAVAIGHRLSWAPAFGYASVVYLAAPRPLTFASAWWTWPVQPWSAHAASWVAAGLFVAGLILYTLHGARAVRDHDH
jgi:hypothetical protein